MNGPPPQDESGTRVTRILGLGLGLLSAVLGLSIVIFVFAHSPTALTTDQQFVTLASLLCLGSLAALLAIRWPTIGRILLVVAGLSLVTFVYLTARSSYLRTSFSSL